MLSLLAFVYPLGLFLSLRYFGLDLDDAKALQLLPLFISVYITILLFISYFQKESFILKFAKRFSKKELSDAELVYINRSTFFWILISCVNIALHVGMILQNNEYYWISYASFGWYFVFAFGGVLQYIHRKYVFLKRVENV